MITRHRLLLVTLLAAALTSLTLTAPASAKTDPRLTRAFYVDTKSSAAKAAKRDPQVTKLAKTAQAFWATDHLAVGKVRSAVRDYAKRAVKKKRTPVVAVYAIPARDCGSHSAGTFNAVTYKKWIVQLAAGLKGKKAIAVLEPDALAMLGNCPAQGDRAGLLRYATKKLKSAGVWVYLDAGHSGWTAPSTMAARLKSAGISSARGFSTNVANFQSTTMEKTYGNLVLGELKKLKITGKRYVIDTSRNGSAKVAAGDFCNPLPARIGAKPKIFRKGNLQAYLWVKNPGESDGACNGGPAAGAWWQTGARRLLGK